MKKILVYLLLCFIPLSVWSQDTPESMQQRSFDLVGRPISDSHHGLHIIQTPNGAKKVVK